MWLTDPTKGPIWGVALVDTVDASGGEQWLLNSNTRFRQYYPTTTGNIPAEPQLQAQLTGGYTVNQMTHVTVFMARQGGTGTWEGAVQFMRFNTSDQWPPTDSENPISNITIPTSTGTIPALSFFRNPYPENFLRRSPGDASSTDDFVGRVWVKPGSGTATVFAGIYLSTGTRVPPNPGYGELFKPLG